ncbi:MAG: transcription termination/antitermination protein NusG [Bryobacteraceae bacterium]
MPEPADMLAQWFALSVKPNHERSVAQLLEWKGWATFLPMYRSRRRWSDRIKELELPLFAGYVFCRFPVGDKSRILSTPSVVSIVGFAGKPVAVTDEEIELVRKMTASGLPVGPWPYLRVGQRVRIEAGPLSGLEGILLQLKDAWRVVVSIELLQRSVAAEVDRDVVSPVLRPASGRPCAAEGVRAWI